jgi:hypothetical protein
VHEEPEEAVARRIVSEELLQPGWSVAELRRRAKAAAAKVQMAHRLRQETALTLRRVAELLEMGAPTHVAHLLYPPRSSLNH